MEPKFFWIKLQNNFYDNNEKIDYLLSQKKGSDYVVLYQMLCLKSVNNCGNLSCQVGEVKVPFDVEKIVRDCKYFSKDTVIEALNLYKKLGLMYKKCDGTLQIADFDQMIGSETRWAVVKRKQREQSGQSLDNVQQMSDTMSNKRLDIRDKSIEIDNMTDVESNFTCNSAHAHDAGAREISLENFLHSTLHIDILRNRVEGTGREEFLQFFDKFVGVLAQPLTEKNSEDLFKLDMETCWTLFSKVHSVNLGLHTPSPKGKIKDLPRYTWAALANLVK